MIEAKNRKKRTLQEDLNLLEYLAEHTVKDAAAKYGVTAPSIRMWLNRYRKRLSKLESYLARVHALQKRSARIKKFTTIGSVPETLEDEEN
jgi:transposase